MTEKTPKHAAAPWICSACRDNVEQQAEQHRGMPTILKACRHTAPGAVTIAIAFVAAGGVQTWQLQGPLSEHEAESMARAYLKTHQQGVIGTKVTRQ